MIKVKYQKCDEKGRIKEKRIGVSTTGFRVTTRTGSVILGIAGAGEKSKHEATVRCAVAARELKTGSAAAPAERTVWAPPRR